MSARAAMLAKAHIARKDLALAEDTYRAIVLRVTGCESAAAASEAQLDALLAEFRRLGWRPKKGRRPSEIPHVRKIYAIWAELAPLLDDAGEEALRGFVRRQTRSAKSPAGIERPEWLDGVEAARVIEGLKGWLARERGRQPEDAT